MRLLKLVGPGDFSLVQVPTHNTFPYATLSHTWIDGQEVTYQELISGTGKSKSGYGKLKFCGEQAMKDGLLLNCTFVRREWELIVYSTVMRKLYL
jgi:hypothetical protein